MKNITILLLYLIIINNLLYSFDNTEIKYKKLTKFKYTDPKSNTIFVYKINNSTIPKYGEEVTYYHLLPTKTLFLYYVYDNTTDIGKIKFYEFITPLLNGKFELIQNQYNISHDKSNDYNVFLNNADDESDDCECRYKELYNNNFPILEKTLINNLTNDIIKNDLTNDIIKIEKSNINISYKIDQYFHIYTETKKYNNDETLLNDLILIFLKKSNNEKSILFLTIDHDKKIITFRDEFIFDNDYYLKKVKFINCKKKYDNDYLKKDIITDYITNKKVPTSISGNDMIRIKNTAAINTRSDFIIEKIINKKLSEYYNEYDETNDIYNNNNNVNKKLIENYIMFILRKKAKYLCKGSYLNLSNTTDIVKYFYTPVNINEDNKLKYLAIQRLLYNKEEQILFNLRIMNKYGQLVLNNKFEKPENIINEINNELCSNKNSE